jgi:low temperature requirement protein LtrA
MTVVSTQLELLFDLTFVVAIGAVEMQLGHGLAEAHAVEVVAPFLQVFFAIWWAWMNFTWFAFGGHARIRRSPSVHGVGRTGLHDRPERR